MGKTYEPIMFADDRITIDVHTATHAEHLRPMTLAEFAAGEPISMRRCVETGDWEIRKRDRRSLSGPAFIVGRQICA